MYMLRQNRFCNRSQYSTVHETSVSQATQLVALSWLSKRGRLQLKVTRGSNPSIPQPLVRKSIFRGCWLATRYRSLLLSFRLPWRYSALPALACDPSTYLSFVWILFCGVSRKLRFERCSSTRRTSGTTSPIFRRSTSGSEATKVSQQGFVAPILRNMRSLAPKANPKAGSRRAMHHELAWVMAVVGSPSCCSFWGSGLVSLVPCLKAGSQMRTTKY